MSALNDESTQQLSDLADELCREDISSGLFWQLLSAMKRTGEKHTYQKWNKEMPVLLISGEDDPVGDSGKGVKLVEKSMKQQGMKQVTMQLHPKGRHDILHEEASGIAESTRQMIKKWVLEN